MWLFLCPKKFADVLNGILQKTLASISILQTQNYKSAEKFVNVLQQYTKKLAETSVSKFKIALQTENFANVFNGKFAKKQQVRIYKSVSENKQKTNAKLHFLRVEPENIIHHNKKRLLLLQRAFC